MNVNTGFPHRVVLGIGALAQGLAALNDIQQVDLHLLFKYTTLHTGCSEYIAHLLPTKKHPYHLPGSSS